MKKDTHQISRRSFIRQSACATLGLTGLVDALAHLTLLNSTLAQSTGSTDYRALVVLYLLGGNDGNNTLIPRMGHAEYANYKNNRGVLKILDENDPQWTSSLPHSIALNGGLYGVHPNSGPASNPSLGLANLYNTGELGFVANVGTLCEKIETRDDFLNAGTRSIILPRQLYSHADQQVQWQSSVSDKPYKNGWGGRIMDILHDVPNYTSGDVSMNISLAGMNKLQVGNETVQYSVSPEGVVNLAQYGNNPPYHLALNSDGTYKTTNEGKILQGFDQIMDYTHKHLLEEGYNQVVRQARLCEGTIGATMTAAAGVGVNFDTIFGSAAEGLMGQLKMVAKLIAGRSVIGNARQIFFCAVGGYDTHHSQMSDHVNLMTELGSSLKAFSDAMKALQVNDNVLTITQSDFTRTLTPNSTNASAAGSDHGWGGHQIVMGGSVQGGKIYGQFPSLACGNAIGSRDTDRGRGRWIPTTSVDQYSAVAARWLGVSGSELTTIFPNLDGTKFEDPFSAAANLGYVIV